MNRNNDKILLVGDIGRAFINKDLQANSDCDICTSIPQAIEAVKNNTYSTIAVVIWSIQSKLNTSIKIFRENSSARIVLLAQMYEEPIAIRLMNLSYNDKPLVDDYMICPIDADNFYRSVFGVPCTEPQNSELSTLVTAKADAAAEQYELSTRIRHLEKLATEDDLTGLKNRRYIMEFTRQIIEYVSQGSGDAPQEAMLTERQMAKLTQKENGRVTLLVFDIDNFKKYNDLYGHMAGDEILKQASHLMRRCCRPHDVVGRIGGDEFAVVFWDDPSILKTVIEQLKVNDRRSIDSDHPHEAMLIAKRFISELEKTPSLFSNPNNIFRNRDQLAASESEHSGQVQRTELGPEGIGTLTISGGLASYPRDGKTVQELFEQADKALLEAKRDGKNRIYLVGKP